MRRTTILLIAACLICSPALAGFGKLNPGDLASKAKSVTKVGKAMRKGFSDLTEQEEYYIGRTVAAMILAQYKVYNDPALTSYVNRVGGLCAAVSDRPDTFSGYHFWVLDSDEINAFATPGGFIFVTRGLLARAPDEDAVAAVMAHEVAHVCLKHGLKAIKNSRLTSAFGILAAEGAKQYGPEEVAQLTEAFDGAINDIMQNMMEKGYSRGQEYEADALAIDFLGRAGYSSKGLLNFLQELSAEQGGEHKGKGFGKTHPSPQDRLQKADKVAAGAGGASDPSPSRTKRWKPLLGKLPRK